MLRWCRATERALAGLEAPRAPVVESVALAHEAAAARGAVAWIPEAKVSAAGARFERAGDVIRLHEGTVTVDARGAAPVAVESGGTRVAVEGAAATVATKRGAIATVTVIAGTVEVNDRGRSYVVAAGGMWEAPVKPEPSPAADEAFAAFRDGWTALRAGRDAEAIERFDRATHRDIAEDAAYWAAVAAERMGDRHGAVRRFDGFLARFPTSARADGARAAVERLR
ncbi:MAG: hypothetical protein KIT31_16040 [Deltaproteobacteria bacterium]|nr:hypothetical protein [Deltaproteobacteria bacterium]